MIYCGALFCPGRPRFVLLGLYHSSAAAINPPCLLLPIQRHILPPAPHGEPWDDVAERLSVAAVEGPRQKGKGAGRGVGGGAGGVLGAQAHLGGAGVWEEKPREWGSRGGREGSTQREEALSVFWEPAHVGKTFCLHLSCGAELAREALGMGARVACE